MTSESPSADTLDTSKKARPYLIGAALVFAALWAGGLFWNLQTPDCHSQPFCLPVNTSWRFIYETDPNSVNGLTRIDNATAFLTLDGEKTRTFLKARAFANDTWGDSISTSSLAIKGVSLQSTGKPINLRVEIDVPDLSADIGKSGSIEYVVDTTYPKVISGDNVVERSLAATRIGAGANFLRYEDTNETFKRFKVAVRISPEKLPSRVPAFLLWISAILCVLTGLAASGSTETPKPTQDT